MVSNPDLYSVKRPFGRGPTTRSSGDIRSPWLLTTYPSPGMILQVHGWLISMKDVSRCVILIYMGVSKNRGGPPKSSILIGFSIINHPFWGTIIFGNTHINLGDFLGMARCTIYTITYECHRCPDGILFVKGDSPFGKDPHESGVMFFVTHDSSRHDMTENDEGMHPSNEKRANGCLGYIYLDVPGS